MFVWLALVLMVTKFHCPKMMEGAAGQFNPLTHWGGPIGPPLFQRPVAQKVMTLKKFVKISYSTEIILALNLSSGVSSKKVVLYK